MVRQNVKTALCEGSFVDLSNRKRKVVKKLKAYREHPPVRDINGLIVEDTYSVGEIEGIITGKELFTTGEFIDSLISLIDEGEKLAAQQSQQLNGAVTEAVSAKEHGSDAMSIKYYALASYDEYPDEVCVLRYRQGDRSDYRFYVSERIENPIVKDNLNETLGNGDAWAECPYCHTMLAVLTDGEKIPNYCPVCGAKIEVEE